MTSEDIRKSFLNFFEKNGHTIVPSSSLIPDDPSVLLTTAGMQQFKKYFTGELDAQVDFKSQNTTSSQKCFRTSDIDEVGDKTHLTFFEMLGNFSFGGYFKREAIKYAYEFITEKLGIEPARIRVTVFAGDSATADGGVGVPYDKESYDIWHKEIGLSADKISKHNRQENFWGPTGNEGPCGPTTEIYVDNVEIWNIVFNEYYCKPDKSLEKLKMPGVDTGMGLERLVVMMQGVDNVFETDIFHPIMSKIFELRPGLDARVARILSDHLRSSIFLIGDGVRPSNKEAGYILRRLLRRVLAYQVTYDIHADLFPSVAKIVADKFGTFYPEVKKIDEILEVLEMERQKFQTAITTGLSKLKKYENVTGQDAFYLYETFGLPFEIVKELAPAEAVKNLSRQDFDEEFKKHQELSRAGAEKKFGGHGLILDTGELKAHDEEELGKVLRLHTATHLLQAALRKVLGDEVKQRGSDITAERTRFDYSFTRKPTPEELKQVEDIINEVVGKDLPVGFIEMSKEEAEKTGALYFFKERYPEKVKVYYVGHSLDEAFSKEFCGGPHVERTSIIGNFKIAKEESIGAGVRRIRGMVS
ncbi:MAG: alanine--tRNA ligase [bacterium]|nr:alanine--tRNA ligase [bacterium]